MSDWIILTPALVCEALSSEQSETVSSRPHQGTALDPLSVAISDATSRVRAAVRQNGLNILSVKQQSIPPELKEPAITLALLRLSEIWPIFYLGKSFDSIVANAEHTLKSVADGSLPIAIPADPQADDNVRRSTGVSIQGKRADKLNAQRLRGL